MKTLSIRDVIGPIMIGPSSSHTAGALRIASMCRNLLSGAPKRATFHLYGSFSETHHGHGTDKALVAGMLGMAADDLRIRESFEEAKRQGFAFEFILHPNVRVNHSNTVDIVAEDGEGAQIEVRGESIGGGAAVITRINKIEVSITGEYHSIVVKQQDAKGVLAHIANTINACDINIATTRLFRERKGEVAYTIMQTDDEIPSRVADALLLNPEIKDVRIIRSDRATERQCPAQSNEGTHAGFAAGLSQTEAAELFERLNFESAAQMIEYCNKEGVQLSEAICRRERCMLVSDGIDEDDTRNYLVGALQVMRESAMNPIKEPIASIGGLLGGEAQKISAARDAGASPFNTFVARAAMYSMAVLETNASMGRIVAAPTAGASGVLPGVLIACQEEFGFSDHEVERALANSAAIGYLITRNANVSGAEGGCQAEIGSASAMAASAICELFGGTPEQCFNAASNALMGLMGLVCDPVAGLVEVPCQKRNATGAANAIVSAQIALAGIGNLANFDETVEAMRRVGSCIPYELRETALGGIATTPSACKYCANR